MFMTSSSPQPVPENGKQAAPPDRLAYLISAYRDPEHLARLIAALDDRADFYVHLDARVDERPFRSVLPRKVRFVPRHRISWGGWQQVVYQHELLRAALAGGTAYSHLVCLSAQDYPLWSNSRIHRYFREHADRQFIGGHDLTLTDDAQQLRKITCLHPFRDLDFPSQWFKDKLVVASRTVLRLLGVRRRPVVKLGGKHCHVFFGSDYWALTPDCACHVCHVLESEPGFCRYFRTAFVPSELCVQTIVYNSRFAPSDAVLPNPYPGLTRLTPLHFIDYGEGIRQLTMDDLPRLQQSGKMFCRKVVSGVSDELARHIDLLRLTAD